MSNNFSEAASQITVNRQQQTKWEANKAALSSLPDIIWNTAPATMDYSQYRYGKPELPEDQVYSPWPSNPTVKTVFLSNLEYGMDEAGMLPQINLLTETNHIIDLIKAGTPITPPIYIIYKEVIDGVVKTMSGWEGGHLVGGMCVPMIAKMMGASSIKIQEWQHIEAYVFSVNKWDFDYFPASTGVNAKEERIVFTKKADTQVRYMFFAQNVNVNYGWADGDGITRITAQRWTEYWEMRG